MPTNRLTSVLQRLLSSVGPATGGEVTDADLLDRFVSRRDEAAFELLIWRHGPMVMGLCQRMLRNEQDAEDAFQATFLILVRKARSISKLESLASWLYKVAYRIACRARPRVPVLSNQDVVLDAVRSPETHDGVMLRDVRMLLDEELARLPESYRRPMILCYLEGKTNDEAARLLGWPKGTVATRLTRGRERLRLQLCRRGWPITGVALAAVLTDNAAASALTPELVGVTLRGALALASGSSTAATVSTKAMALSEGVLRIMWYNKLKMISSIVMGILICGAGFGLAARSIWAADSADDPVGGRVEAAVVAPPAEPAAPVQKKSASKAQTQEIETLRNEVATLRRELETALKEISELKTALKLPTTPPADQGPLYRGRPAKFWLEQLKDGDPAYRKDAVVALGALTEKNKALIPVLVGALKDRDYDVVGAAFSAFGSVGPDAVPLLLEVVKDKTVPDASVAAVRALANIGPAAKAAIPLLLEGLRPIPNQTLNYEVWEFRRRSVEALRCMGPEAKPAIPRLIMDFASALDLFEKPAPVESGKRAKFRPEPQEWAYDSYNALLRIDPELEEILPDALDNGLRTEWRGNDTSGRRRQFIEVWRQAVEALRKKYPPRTE